MIKYFLDPPALPHIDLRFERKSAGASGYDLMANIGMPRTIYCRAHPEAGSVDGEMLHGRRWQCHTGLYLEMPIGVEAQVRTRSGLARNHGIVVLNAPGTVDSDFRGEITISLINLGDRDYEVLPGDRIAQIVFAPVLGGHLLKDSVLNPHNWEPQRVVSRDQLSDTDRGSSGHGSSGR